MGLVRKIRPNETFPIPTPVRSALVLGRSVQLLGTWGTDSRRFDGIAHFAHFAATGTWDADKCWLEQPRCWREQPRDQPIS